MAKTSGNRVSLLRARRIVTDFEASPLSAEKYAKEKGLNPMTLRWYIKRVKTHEAQKSATSSSPVKASPKDNPPEHSFVTITPEPAKSITEIKPDTALTLEFTNLKCNLRIDEGVNPEFLKLVVEALGSCSN